MTRACATAGDFAKLKGKRFGVTALGSINQYTAAQALLKAGLDPAKDVQWIVNVPQPDLMRMLGQNQVDATDLAYQFGFFAQNNKWGPIVVNDDEVVPGAEIATYAVRKDFLQKNRDAVVRFAMAYLQGIKEFNAAARDPGAHPDIVDILAQNTALNKPELVRAIAPHWSYIADDGLPLVEFDHGDAGLLERQVFQLRGKESAARTAVRPQRRERGAGAAGEGKAVLARLVIAREGGRSSKRPWILDAPLSRGMTASGALQLVAPFLLDRLRLRERQR